MDNSPKAVKISEKFPDLPRLKVFDDVLKSYENDHPFSPAFSVIDRNTYLGIEVEIENVDRWDSNLSPYWTIIEDGSLRNNGREFITPPIRAWRVEHALTKLFASLNPDIDFSERTSIHVHMNVRTLTVEQLEALIVTYMLFEKAIFSFIGDNRYDNIFCVPLCETDMGASLEQLITNGSPYLEWEKYTALNLLPISSKGTLEFRHLAGTRDLTKIMTWINIILSLKTFSLRNDVEYIWHRINSLNTTSEYRMFGEEVFGNMIHHIFSPTFNQDVASCITYVKDKCLPNDFLKELQQLNAPNTVSLAYNPEDYSNFIWHEATTAPTSWETFDPEQAVRVQDTLNRIRATQTQQPTRAVLVPDRQNELRVPRGTTFINTSAPQRTFETIQASDLMNQLLRNVA